MSGGQLPRWVDYGLIPFLNLAAAFSGLRSCGDLDR